MLKENHGRTTVLWVAVSLVVSQVLLILHSLLIAGRIGLKFDLLRLVIGVLLAFFLISKNGWARWVTLALALYAGASGLWVLRTSTHPANLFAFAPLPMITIYHFVIAAILIFSAQVGSYFRAPSVDSKPIGV
jgi:hypothetical protein